MIFDPKSQVGGNTNPHLKFRMRNDVIDVMTSSMTSSQTTMSKRSRSDAGYSSFAAMAGAAPRRARRQLMSAAEKKLRRDVRKEVRHANWNAMGMRSDHGMSLYQGPAVMGLGPDQASRIGRLGQIMGKGGYWGKRIGGYLGELVGNRTFGERLGDKVGDAVGSVVPHGDLIANVAKHVLVGPGRYELAAAPVESFQPASFGGQDVDRIRVKSREYLGAVSGSASFTLKTLTLNPGLQQVFPQLSKLAMHYQQYKFHGLVFQYHSTSSDSVASADTALGEVLMANQPDSTEADPISKQEMVGLDGAKQAKPSIDQLHGIECAGDYSIMKYIRHGDPIEATQDAARFDLGKVHLGVEGCNAAVTRIGELWVAYDVELIRSRDSRGQEVAAASIHTPNSTQDLLFGGTGLAIRYNSIGCTFAGNTITFPSFLVNGDYKITVSLLGTATLGGTFGFQSPMQVNLVNCSILNEYQSQGKNTVLSATDVSSVTCVTTLTIRINSPSGIPASITFSTSANPVKCAIWPAAFPGATSGYTITCVTKVPQTNAGDW